MGKSIWDTRFGKRGIVLDEYVQVEEGDSWKTIHGAHVLLGDDGRIKAGAGGKFNGSNLERYKQTDEKRAEKMREKLHEIEEEVDKKTSVMLLEGVKNGTIERNKYFRERAGAQRDARMQARLEFLNQHHEESNPPKPLERPLSEEEVINKIAGGDDTYGSCASTAAAYIANQVLGLDVRDFRGGASQIVGSSSAMDALEEIENSEYDEDKEGGGVIERDVVFGTTSFVESAMSALDAMKPNEPYVAIIGRHMAMVRTTGEGGEHPKIEYLELQSSNSSGWKSLVNDQSSYLTLNDRTKALDNALERRFGLTSEIKQSDVAQGVVPAKRFAETDYMKKLLPYINTSEDKQMKGSGGGIK